MRDGWLADTSLGRMANLVLILSLLALGAALFVAEVGPLLVLFSWIFLAVGSVLGLLDDLLEGRVSRVRWMLAILELLLLAVLTKVVAAAVPVPGLR